MTIVSLLLGFLGPVLRNDVSFDAFITERLDVIDKWVLKIEKCVPEKFIHSKLYNDIISNVSNAMLYDFNLIIEEYVFYQ